METNKLIEIRTKWIRHTPHLKLDDCVDSAMREYAQIACSEMAEELREKKLNDAIEFAEWLRTECNCFDSSPQWYYLNDGENTPKTSEELYQIFLKTK